MSKSQRLQALWQLATTRDKSDAEKMQLMLRLGWTIANRFVLVNELRRVTSSWCICYVDESALVSRGSGFLL